MTARATYNRPSPLDNIPDLHGPDPDTAPEQGAVPVENPWLVMRYLPPPSPEERLLLERGVCKGSEHHTATFPYPTEEQAKSVQEALRMCRRCPVISECRVFCERLEADLPADARYLGGIWAGETPEDRARRRKKRKRGLRRKELEQAVRSFVGERYRGTTLVGRAYDLTNEDSKEEFIDGLIEQYRGITAVLDRDADAGGT